MPSSESLFVGQGFSLPDAQQPRLAHVRVLRDFNRTQVTRIVRPAAATVPSAPKTPPQQPTVEFTSPSPTLQSTTDPSKKTTTLNSAATATPEAVTSIIEELPKPMTSPSSAHLPGNGFSVWIEQSPASHAIRLVSDTPNDAAHGGSGSTNDSGGSNGSGGNDDTPSNFKPQPESSKPSGGGGLFKWVAGFLLLCGLGAFLSSESGRKEALAEKEELRLEKNKIAKERKGFFDNWEVEKAKSAELTEEVSGLSSELTTSKANITQLNAEKTGLSKTIEQLQGTLAMTIKDAESTEMTLRKAIQGLETKNEEITSSLQQEQEKLKGLDTRLAEVMSELNNAKASNQKLVEEKTSLEEKVAQLQSSLDKAVKDAEASETELRKELASLKKANEDLAASVASKDKELLEAKDKLKATEEGVVKEKENSQSQVDDLSQKLQEAVVARDSLNEEKQALAASVAQMTEQLQGKSANSPTTVALEERISSLESEKSESASQVKELVATRDDLLHRNGELQNSVEKLNAHLSKLAESEETQEGALTKRIAELTKNNTELQETLKKQRSEFNALLRSSNSVEPVSEPSASALEGAVQDLKKTLGKSLNREVRSKEQITSLLSNHTNDMLELNTLVARTQSELDLSKGLLTELDALREEVRALRSQGEILENELAQRASHISTLNKDNASWQQETDKLRQLLATEQLAQNKLHEFAKDLQVRITDLETPAASAVAEK